MEREKELLTLVQAISDQKSKETEVHWTVKVFGGVIISVSAIVLIGAFQSVFQSIAECNRTIHQQSLLMQPKENMKPLWENIKDMKAEIKTLERQNRDLQHEVQRLKIK